MLPREHSKVIRWAIEFAQDHGLQPDPSCKDAARAWFVPCTEAESEYEYVVAYEADAPPLVVDELLGGECPPLGGEVADDKEFICMDGSRVQVVDWGRSASVGDKIRGACPWVEGASLGSAFLRRCKTHVMCVCTSQNHGHESSPWITRHFFEERVSRHDSGDPSIEVLGSLDFVMRNGAPTGRPKPTASNLDFILRLDPRWTGRVWRNGFTGEVMLDERAWVDEDDVHLTIWLDRVYGSVWSTKTVRETVGLFSQEHEKNPLQEMILAEEWDTECRLDDWLDLGFGVPKTPITSVIARKWAIQAVARAVRPGCQADSTLVLVGPQGAGKSTGLRALAGDDYFSDTPLDFSKDAFLQIQRAWIYEIAELDSFRGRAHSQIKAFLSASSDTYRQPYAVKPKTHLRHCCFAASTNETAILSDATGSRRFWPVQVTRVNREWIKKNRMQLWSEAYAALKAGETWWMSASQEGALRESQEKYQVSDAWDNVIIKWADDNTTAFTMELLMCEALGMQKWQMDVRKQMRIAETLRRGGYEKKRLRDELGRKTTVWQRVKSEEDEGYEDQIFGK